ncbi:MAG: succinate dehydrogenase, partial [Dysosmobacter sp.]|nr:succinate dehydrogenase [Dysosmobacter sp.]
MRALLFILKLLLKILVAPVILLLTVAIWICVGIVYISGLVLGLISMVVALLGV